MLLCPMASPALFYPCQTIPAPGASSDHPTSHLRALPHTNTYTPGLQSLLFPPFCNGSSLFYQIPPHPSSIWLDGCNITGSQLFNSVMCTHYVSICPCMCGGPCVDVREHCRSPKDPVCPLS